MDERRRLPRYELHADAAVIAGEPAGGGEAAQDAVQNISLGGICVRSENIQDVGTMVDLVVSFPDEGVRLEVSGAVVWVNREPPAEMGIRFQDLDEATRGKLREILLRAS
jgi:uncharacterized protein (TIGR02266 family)